jgi:hypothetical protein
MTDTPARKKSEQRQRQKQIKIRCTADEFNAVAAKAGDAGHTVAGYARAAMLGEAGPRAQRRLPIDARLVRKALALHGQYGNNLNQIAHVLNAEGGRAVLEADIRTALKEWGEIRDVMLQALGLLPMPAAAVTKVWG